MNPTSSDLLVMIIVYALIIIAGAWIIREMYKDDWKGEE